MSLKMVEKNYKFTIQNIKVHFFSFVFSVIIHFPIFFKIFFKNFKVIENQVLFLKLSIPIGSFLPLTLRGAVVVVWPPVRVPCGSWCGVSSVIGARTSEGARYRCLGPSCFYY